MHMKTKDKGSHTSEACYHFYCSCQSRPKQGIFNYLQKRQVDYTLCKPYSLVQNHSFHFMPRLFRETQLPLGTLNKVFTSQWFSDKHVVFGTKCNKLIVIDITTNHLVSIPLLQSSEASSAPEISCGIHSIAINPSQTLIATGGENTNDLAIYQLPSFDPVYLGKGGHLDWIFDIVWLDDQYVLSGSRDTTLAVWNVSDQMENDYSDLNDNLPVYFVQKPVAVESCKLAEKIRSLVFNKQRQEAVALSLNAYISVFDICSFKQKFSQKLQYCKENVCLAINNDCNMYAVGSKSHVTFIDPRTLGVCNVVDAHQKNCGIRSVSFQGDTVTVGTGVGAILFYDLRNKAYLNCPCGKMCSLKANKGWLLHNETYEELFRYLENPQAIYTHCYDSTGTKLFAAGGPLPAGLSGNYAALWE